MTDKNTVVEDFLDEDAEISGQRYVLLSFISPEKVLEKKDVHFFKKFLESYEVDWKLKNLEKYMVDVVKGINDQLDDRIKKTMDHISVTGRPVMGIDGNPVDPRQPVGEAEYQGREVTLNKPTAGDVAKSKVYVKNAKGNVVKVNFGDKNMTIKKSNPARRKSFRARHRCENPGPKWKARYWSCRAW